MAALSAVGDSLQRSLRIMARNKVGFAGFLTAMAIIVAAYLAPLFVPLDRTAKVEKIYQPPSAEHWLGTDFQGRDNLSQILNGGREVIYVAVLTALGTVLIAVTLGALGAILGGWADTVVVGLADLILTIPQFPLLLVLAGFMRLHSPASLALVLAAVGWGALMRAIRAQVLSLQERDYVEAARALGLPTSHLLAREILPGMMSYIAVQFVFAMTNAIYSQVGLIFLGIIPMASHNWGVMFTLAWNQGAVFSRDSMWYLMAPVAVIVILQFSLVSMTRSLDELFNPRLRVGD